MVRTTDNALTRIHQDGLDKSLGVTRVETLKDLLSTVDVISVNCDLNKDNHHLLNNESLAWIPPGKGKNIHSLSITSLHSPSPHTSRCILGQHSPWWLD